MVYLSRTFLDFFPKPVYSTIVAKKFQIYSVKYIYSSNTFLSQKIELFIFTRAPKENSPPGFSHYLPGKWELPIPIEQRFLKIFFPEEKGGREL